MAGAMDPFEVTKFRKTNGDIDHDEDDRGGDYCASGDNDEMISMMM